ncbi:MAG: valine--tRNA ligase [Alphaproteobacteria bacterium]|nr:valine--tRNA ligase [Alphaproteobacteria bacterium]
MLDKNFDPKSFESAVYQKSESHFVADPTSPRPRYTIMMPPPNVTGSLHLGHALTYTLQDVLARFKRQCGFDVLWQPGTDHAGIATQMVVERELAKDGITRQQLGREKFLEKVWAWKETSGNTIVEQQRRLGISPDWARSRFTMDEGLSKAVTKVFVELHKQGLIYKDKRLVNWDPHFKTAISDVEVINHETKGSLWHIRYPFVDNPEDGIVVATTRPETLFGDMAVAVHPDDERYQSLVGKFVHLPLTNRMIPIIADDYCDPTKGSGAVKITPGHDFNDFAVGQRHQLEIMNILTDDAHLNDCVPMEFQGLNEKDARAKVLSQLEEQELLVKTESITHMVPYGDRSGVRIQPWLTDQWFVDAKTLAGPALKAVEDGRTCFMPEQWTATYYEWLRNIQPWCISRQLWWGHQIPVWYGPDGAVFVAETAQDAQSNATAHYGKDVDLTRDSDVLDTWFSSALWPFSTLGWPDETPELARYYPTDVLVTGFDIIFFWVARMMMMGLHFMGDVPFRTVYIHALVRDEKGQKMSKSKGNIVDPLYIIDKYGSDALRFTLAALAAPGRDVKLGESRVEGYRNFITKLWNSARFLQMNDCSFDPDFDPDTVQSSLNQWIVAKTIDLGAQVHAFLEHYRYDLAAQAVYQFLWGTYCDIYVECLKPCLGDGVPDDAKQETRQTATWVLMEFLKIAHPFIPSITEHLWAEFYPTAPTLLMATQWPIHRTAKTDGAEISWAISIVTEARSLRGLLNIAPNLKIPMVFHGAAADWTVLEGHLSWVCHLARLGEVQQSKVSKAEGVPFVIGDNTFFLKLGGLIDLPAAHAILTNKQATLSKELQHLDKKLQNTAYKQAKPDQWQDDVDLCGVKQQEVSKLQFILENWQG